MTVVSPNIEDGFVNGTCGILKYIQLNPTPEIPEVLLFEFNPKSIRSETCIK